MDNITATEMAENSKDTSPTNKNSRSKLKSKHSSESVQHRQTYRGNPLPRSLLHKKNPSATDLGRALLINYLNFYTEGEPSQFLTYEDGDIILSHLANMTIEMQLTYQKYYDFCNTGLYNIAVEYSYCMRTVQYNMAKICHELDLTKAAEELAQRGLKKTDPFYKQHNAYALLAHSEDALDIPYTRITFNLTIMRATDVYLDFVSEALKVKHLTRIGKRYWDITEDALKKYETRRQELKVLQTDTQTSEKDCELAAMISKALPKLRIDDYAPDEKQIRNAREYFFSHVAINERETRTKTISLLLSESDDRKPGEE